MNKILCGFFGLTFFVFSAQNVLADDFSDKVTALSTSIAEQLKKHKTANVAVADFVDLRNEPNELGRLIAEELTTSLIGAGGNFSVVDRANLRLILDEHQLSASGLVDPANIKELGRIAGVDGVLIGSISILGNDIRVNARVVSTETAKAIAAKSIAFDATESMRDMFAMTLPTVERDQNSGKESTKSGKSRRKAAAGFKNDFVTAHFENGAVKGNELQVTATIENTGKDIIEFNLDLDRTTSFQTTNGFLCTADYTASYSLPSSNGFMGDRAVKLAPGDNAIFSIKKIMCGEGNYAPEENSMLTIGLYVLLRDKVGKLSLRFKDPVIAN
jgi:TolB-like protein